MAPTEDFWNLQSKFRGKKEFNFYDKMVPQPFKITPSPTPTMSPTLTPTPTPSYDPCNIYNSFCFYATGGLSFINGIYYETSLTGSIDLSFVSGSTWSGTIDCGSNYAIYTGTTESLSTGVWMFDSGGDYQFFELKTGSLGCGNSIEVIYQLVYYTTPDVSICDGIIYASEADLEGYITYGGVCPTPTPTQSITPSPTPTPSVGWNSIYEFTIDTTNTQTNSSNSSSFDFLRTSWNFLNPDPGDIVIYWGDGSSSSPYDTGGRTHTYSSPGIYNIIVDSGSNSFFDKIGTAFITTANGLSGDCSKVIGCNRRPVNGVLGDFTACRNFTGFTGQAQYQVLTGSTDIYFRYCNSLVSGLSNFDVSQVTSMDNMFVDCFAYNENLSSWDTGNVTNMAAMFYSATSWNQNVGMWDISSVTHGLGGTASFVNTFGQTNLSTANYDQILIGWAAQAPNINSGLYLFGVPCGYTSAAQSARNLLTSTYGWTINDGGLVP